MTRQITRTQRTSFLASASWCRALLVAAVVSALALSRDAAAETKNRVELGVGYAPMLLRVQYLRKVGPHFAAGASLLGALRTNEYRTYGAGFGLFGRFQIKGTMDGPYLGVAAEALPYRYLGNRTSLTLVPQFGYVVPVGKDVTLFGELGTILPLDDFSNPVPRVSLGGGWSF